MPLQVRRVVTGHKDDGKATILIDEISTNVLSLRPGTSSAVIWTTTGFPVNNDGDDDTEKGATGTTLANGTVFRLVEFGPGNTPRNHRTDSVDYAIVMRGEIDMELDDEVVHIKAGDVLVQRGTIHNWVNKSSEPCLIAFILIDAKPVTAGGKVLEAHG
jgi:quercetin dioxygenase-like cupin family protein